MHLLSNSKQEKWGGYDPSNFGNEGAEGLKADGSAL